MESTWYPSLTLRLYSIEAKTHNHYNNNKIPHLIYRKGLKVYDFGRVKVWVSISHLEGVWKVSVRGLEGVGKASGRCLEGV